MRARSDNRVLVLGGTGMLGHKLVQTLSDEFDLWCSVRRPWSDLLHLNIFDQAKTLTGACADDFSSVSQAIQYCEPNFVVNCIGVIKQSQAASDPVQTISVNTLFPHQVAACCTQVGAKLIHVSTDCVFAGTKGNYNESDPCDAQDLYGRSKALGETVYDNHLTLRTSIVGPELYEGHGLFEWFLSGHAHVNGYSGAVFSGVTTIELSHVIASVIADSPRLSGLYHVASKPIDKFSLLCALRDSIGLSTTIERVTEPSIDRSLDGAKFSAATGYTSPTWDSMIAEVCEHFHKTKGNRSYELAG